jgi:hypothetical protein
MEFLQRALEAFEQELVVVERKRQSITEKIGSLRAMLGKTEWSHEEDDERGSDAKEIRKATRGAIERLGRPVKRADILKELKRNGIVLSAKDPAKAVNRNLFRSKDEFVRVKEGYVVGERPPQID